MIAVSAWFDATTESVIRELWRRMAEAKVDDSLHIGPYRPHITLGVWQEMDMRAAADRLQAVAGDVASFEVKFRALGAFPGHPVDKGRRPGVWLAPTITPELRGLHEATHAGLEGVAAGLVRRHVPGRWEPHCTVAPRLEPAGIPRATEVLVDSGVLPLSGTINRLGLIDTPAEIELDFFPFVASR